MTSPEAFMEQALELARQAQTEDEVPVGAIIVKNGVVIAKAYNQKETKLLATEHAEIIAIREASRVLGSWRLLDCTLYVTLEPCIMCAGAILQARLPRIVFATPDPKGGAVGSLYQLHSDPRLNHSFEVASGILGDECSQILKDFFRKKRKNQDPES